MNVEFHLHSAKKEKKCTLRYALWREIGWGKRAPMAMVKFCFFDTTWALLQATWVRNSNIRQLKWPEATQRWVETTSVTKKSTNTTVKINTDRGRVPPKYKK